MPRPCMGQKSSMGCRSTRAADSYATEEVAVSARLTGKSNRSKEDATGKDQPPKEEPERRRGEQRQLDAKHLKTHMVYNAITLLSCSSYAYASSMYIVLRGCTCQCAHLPDDGRKVSAAPATSCFLILTPYKRMLTH